MRSLEVLGRWEELSKLVAHVGKARGPSEAREQARDTSSLASQEAIVRSSKAYEQPRLFFLFRDRHKKSHVIVGHARDAHNDHARALHCVVMLGARANRCLSQWDRMKDYVTECATHQASRHPSRAVVSKTRVGVART
ncbi:hypothetical protein PsorP6_011834 [Peronosclerospora sorghi]|uniref:Uncharacterized protein n=1 Tax=Peronosclerospora sorghi TaxID=230839 RepID=A0ACC0WKQ5_9STRA|nr:hypothetical protein PsorP6_011834 [Peronosclerospora sorghi]